MEILNEISCCLQSGDDEKITVLTKEALQKNIDPQDILNNSLIPAMNIIGEKFKSYEIFLPDVLLAAKAMYAAMNELKPYLINEQIPSKGKIVIGTVQGDLHDIGKNLVGILLKGAGFDIIDLGKDVPAEKFVQEAKNQKASVIGLSALLTTTMPVMKNVIETLKQEGLYGKIKVIIGGAPVNQNFCNQIGADAYCYDGASAVECLKAMLNDR